MPSLNWNIFEKLPGSQETNFEMLCRSLVRRNYEQFGVFRARAAQPGVEFHLRLESECALGDEGRWYGWQCRWYQLPSGRQIGNGRRDKIKGAIETTERVLPNLTDWVLWTRHPLTAGDQKWFDGLSTKMKLHLWTFAEVEEYLSGEAEVLRGTYFGELVLTPELLRQRHEEAVAPIRRRWLPAVHQAVDAERELRRMLGESGSWKDLRETAGRLRAESQAILKPCSLPGDLKEKLGEIAEAATTVASTLESIHSSIREGDLDLLHQELLGLPAPPGSEVFVVSRRLRSDNHKVALSVTNTLGTFHHAYRLFDQVENAFGARLVPVIAPSGCGKTQVAAQLTSGTEDRPFGVLLHGKELHAGHTLDDLARHFLIAGHPVPSMEALLEALNAAGQRARHRLPITIDGLNEAEDPREWRRLLAAAKATLGKYPYVLFVCTLRPEFDAETLPPEIPKLEIPDLGEDTFDAIRQYFDYYKIDATDVRLPTRLLRHPLTLRLFCEVTNPNRDSLVGLEAIPASLTAVFDRYIEQAGERIAELSPRTHRYYGQDVRAAVDLIGHVLWDQKCRSTRVSKLRQLLGDEDRPWDQSLFRALEQEGILIRVPGDNSEGFAAPAYDALAGHLIANALLSRHGRDEFTTWLCDSRTVNLLTGKADQRHPFATDIVPALVAQVPRRLRTQQFWQMAEDRKLRTWSLRLAANLEANYLDAETVQELIELTRRTPKTGADLLGKFQEASGFINHPLNAEALDEVLRPMEVAERDLRWSEWVRRTHRSVLKDLLRFEKRWRLKGVRDGDKLRAKWVMWTMTTPARSLRDQATKTIYWFGRRDPQFFFDQVIDSLAINDLYLTDRMWAAAYGVAMAFQQFDAEFETHLSSFVHRCAETLFSASATHPTSHWLVLNYARGILEFARRFYPSSIPSQLRGEVDFGAARHVAPIEENETHGKEVDRILHMDFRNYTVGRLFSDRRNYDMDHDGLNAALAHIRGAAWGMGWRESSFGKLDEEIAALKHRWGGDRLRVERYGKKYSWIGYFTFAGLLERKGQLPHDGERLADVDIDPSFPEPPHSIPDLDVSWLSPEITDDSAWLRAGQVEIPDELLRREIINENRGPWVAVYGRLAAEDRTLGRRTFGIISALVVPSADALRLAEALDAGSAIPWLSRNLPGDYYTYAGEIPWSSEFASRERDPDIQNLYREAVNLQHGESAEVEILAHQYDWENYHSELNIAGGALVPSRLFSERFDLRGCPQTFNQVASDGKLVAVSYGGIGGLEGHILYLREDLLREYLDDSQIVWYAWGERLPKPYPALPPNWLIELQRARDNSWRFVRNFKPSGL